MPSKNSFGAAGNLSVGDHTYQVFRLKALDAAGFDTSRIPYSVRVLLENLLRCEDDRTVKRSDIEYVAKWSGGTAQELNFRPTRVLLQDFTGVPCVVDLAAMRDALKSLGSDPDFANPMIPVDLVIDHSVQVDNFGTLDAFDLNVLIEYQRNAERYALLRWAQSSFENFRVVPPGTGIVHQVNLEYLAHVVYTGVAESGAVAYLDSVVGTDSHTTMINGLGVLGWGVGGIEAEACMLGQPISMLLPEVVGFKLTGVLPPGSTATDLVLTVTQMLRKKGVVGKFVEFYGPGVLELTVADRATIANMAPEYGATMGYFPIDKQTLRYLRLTNRRPEIVELVEAYAKEQGIFLEADSPDPIYTASLELDLSTVVPSMAGPKRPQDRIDLPNVKANFAEFLGAEIKSSAAAIDGKQEDIRDGAVVIAAITSCTNTSNPTVMIGAGLVAKKAVARGLMVKPWVKTSLAPGSKVVTDYLNNAGLTEALNALKFNLVGYGCTTCIGNSGPLPDAVAKAVSAGNLTVAAVLSGNRNFEGRINSHVKANYLASPPLVVAYALAGRVDIDLTTEPLGTASDGRPVFLADIWPTHEEIAAVVAESVTRADFEEQYSDVFAGDEKWQSMKVPTGELFAWDEESTYVKRPPYFDVIPDPTLPVKDFQSLRALCVLGDSITTDHISPAGSFKKDTPAGQYLMSRGVAPQDFNSYGARRGHDEVMVRGTLANIRIRNAMVPGVEGGYTTVLPENEILPIYDAAMKYKGRGIGLTILAGKEYGAGSSRDWAAKGVMLLGVKVVIAESFERIHRSNLVGMGVLPCEFIDGQNRETLGLTGFETFDVTMVGVAIETSTRAKVIATAPDGTTKNFDVKVRIDTPVEIEYYRGGGILPYVLRQVAKAHATV